MVFLATLAITLLLDESRYQFNNTTATTCNYEN